MLAISGYTLSTMIYEGSHTRIYHGVRNSDGLKVIIKCLKNEYSTPELLAQFTREYQILKNLHGMGTPKVIGLETQGNTVAIVMDDERYSSKLFMYIKMLKVYRTIRKVDLSKDDLPLMRSERYLLIGDIIGQLMISTINENESLAGLLTCISLQLSMQHGYYKNTTAAGLLFAGFLIHFFNKRKLAFELSDFLMRNENKYNLAVSKGHLLVISTLLINHWRYPLEGCFDNGVKSFQLSLDEEDFFLSLTALILTLFYGITIGKNIAELSKLTETEMCFLQKNEINEYFNIASLFGNIFECIVNPKIDWITTINKHVEGVMESHSTKDHGSLFMFYTLVMEFSFMQGLYEEAKTYGDYALKIKFYLTGTIFWFSHQFFYGLNLLALNLSDKITKKTLKHIHAYLKHCAKWEPNNYKFYLLLFEAELAKNQENILKAMQLYNQSIFLAESMNNLSAIGLANQCAGQFYLNFEFLDIARIHFIKTHYAYQHWGAKTLSKRLEHKFPEWFRVTTSQTQSTTVTIDTSVSSLDVLSLLRATQVISSEIQLEALLKKLIVVLLQNAGAQRGALIMRHGDNWYIAVEGTIAAQQVTLVADKERSIANRQDVPLSLIRYVQRTQELIQAQSAYDFEAFADDPYIKEIKPQSVIVMPINYQGQMTTILFLENRTTSHAFTSEHVHILKVLSSQAVISLENAKLYYQATHDPLTGLANRNLLYQMFELARGRAKRHKTCLAILFLDLDGFKKINDTLGHEVGDKLLIYFAERLKSSIPEGDLAVRLGGDEFIAMLEDTNRTQIASISERLLDKTESIQIQGHEIQIGTSIGISLYPEHGQSIQDLLKQADVALYRAKALGKGNYQFYTDNLDQEVKEENKLESDLAHAADRGEFIMLYQPIYSAGDHVITHFEALLRWQHPSLGLLEPERFIYLAESTGLIIPIGDWVFNAVFKQLQSWKNESLDLIPVAINVSGLQLKKTMLSDTLTMLLKKYDLSPHLLELEFTENIFIDISDKISADIVQLKQIGIKLTLDDFGTHYSSLGYLRRFELDQIKIDQSFIKDITNEEKSCELIISIINMAHNLKLAVIAEGVETEEQMQFLESNGIDALQGFYLGKPTTAVNATMLLTQHTSDLIK